ncbi:kinase-like protein [Metschnikowia bicuspidata]|uniref:non-specific serine/threonine protein kinase n=1 Tax=Metschnikowia bicuspidata TaxID=27322 RepID=A0A4P9ZCC1_9ASCO|nr:kinase-like protein [Metschnikowia bicuspidata]
MSPISEEYDALEVIGKGSFGTVRKVKHKATGEVLVRKEIEYTSMNAQEKNRIISELRILRELKHEHVVRYMRHDHIAERKAIHIYQEYCDGGDLGKVIATIKKNRETVPEEFVWEVLVQTLLALHRCHYGIEAKDIDLFSGTAARLEPEVNSETVVIHRDIKPDNIFLLGNGKVIKLGDFGLAKMLTSQNDFAKTYVGTPYYMSPEVLTDNPYLPVCDIWSLGCVLYELCNLHPPFQATTHLQLQKKIKQGHIPEVSPHYSQQIRSIISSSITVDSARRPSTFELLDLIPVKMFRKEKELRSFSSMLNAFHAQLQVKSDALQDQSEKRQRREQELQRKNEQMQRKEQDLQRKEQNLQRKEQAQELVDEFDARKRAMDAEANELRLNYQREFCHVVEQEVQSRMAEYVHKRGAEPKMELHRKKSDSSATSFEQQIRYQAPKPKGPREYSEEPEQLTHGVKQFALNGQRRSLLKTKNAEHVYEQASPTRPKVVKKRITDEVQKVNIQKRNTPEFEEEYLRQNYRY